MFAWVGLGTVLWPPAEDEAAPWPVEGFCGPAALDRPDQTANPRTNVAAKPIVNRIGRTLTSSRIPNLSASLLRVAADVAGPRPEAQPGLKPGRPLECKRQKTEAPDPFEPGASLTVSAF
jgi:hypothetical protein